MKTVSGMGRFLATIKLKNEAELIRSRRKPGKWKDASFIFMKTDFIREALPILSMTPHGIMSFYWTADDCQGT